MNVPQRRRLESLLSAVCDGRLEQRQRDELDAMLRSSAECRDFYLQYLDMHARLTVHPRLALGIPCDKEPEHRHAELAEDRCAAAPVDDDAVVLELARVSLQRLSIDVERDRAERRRFQAARWGGLALVLLIVVLAWRLPPWWFGHDGRPTIQLLAGVAEIEGPAGKLEARRGRRLREGETLRTGEGDARAVLRYDDGTRVVAHFATELRFSGDLDQRKVRLLAGAIEVDAAEQPENRPLIFETDHARYVVLGTRFRLYREAAASRLELDEGKVRLERQVDGKSVDVEAGQVAVATPEPLPLTVRPLAAGRGQLRASRKKAGQAVAFSENAGLLVTNNWTRGLAVVSADDLADHARLERKCGHSSGLAFAGETVVQLDDVPQQGTVTLWLPGETRATTVRLPGKHVRSRALSPDGRFVAESAADGTYVYRIDFKNAGLERLAVLPDRGKAWCLAMSRSARFAAAGFWDGTVRLYRLPEAETQKGGDADVVLEFRLQHTPTRIALTDGAERLAVFSHQDGLLVVEPGSGHQRPFWAAGAAGVRCLKFTDDGHRLMAGMSDGTARIWSAETARPLLVVDTGHVPKDIDWSERKGLLATANGEVCLWQCDLPAE